MPDKEREMQGDVLTREKTRTQRPPKYKVLLHNDDYTPMDFVTWVLEAIFHRDHAESVRIMLDVYTFEIAESKMLKVHTLAKANEHPLRCSLEPE